MSNTDAEKIDVSYVAQLARLKLSAEETQLFQTQLEDIVGYVDKVRELDVSGVEPMAHGMPVQNVFRADGVRQGLAHDDVIDNAPLARSGQFIVPKIIE
jgi:aspartyl-tRNA(Asn)/glutamyl-tRNA(Gln) amidotransferase subunit C